MSAGLEDIVRADGGAVLGGILHTRCCILGKIPLAQTILNGPTLLLCHLFHMCTAPIKEFILYLVMSHGCHVLK